MSNINGASGQHFISNADFLVWMQEKTNSLYAKMGDAMDVSNDRGDAEDALNNIKAKIADAQAGKFDPNELYTLVNQTITKFGDEFPEVKDTLGQISKELSDLGAQLTDGSADPNQKPYIPPPPPATIDDGSGDQMDNPAYPIWVSQWGVEAAKHPDMIKKDQAAALTIDDDSSKRWQDSIKGSVDNLGQQDQLGMVSIQQYNADLNSAKQMASALMDAANKSAESIISHIS